MCARHDVVAPAPTVYAPTCTPDAHPPGIVPKRRPPRPQQPIFGMFRRGGLRFGHIIPRSRSPRRGKWRHENTDMPKERSSCCKTPALLMRERSEHHNENSTFSQHVLSVLVVGYPPSTPTFPVPTCRKFACQQHVVSYTPRIGLGTRAECPVRFVARQGFAYVLPEEPGGARPTACCRRRFQGIGWYCSPK